MKRNASGTIGPIPHRKVLNHAKDLHGVEFLESVLGTGHMREVEDAYQAVVAEFQEKLCEPCDKKRTMFSWSALGLPAMAKKAGFGLEHCYYNAYAVPTQQAQGSGVQIAPPRPMDAAV